MYPPKCNSNPAKATILRSLGLEDAKVAVSAVRLLGTIHHSFIARVPPPQNRSFISRERMHSPHPRRRSRRGFAILQKIQAGYQIRELVPRRKSRQTTTSDVVIVTVKGDLIDRPKDVLHLEDFVVYINSKVRFNSPIPYRYREISCIYGSKLYNYYTLVPTGSNPSLHSRSLAMTLICRVWKW